MLYPNVKPLHPGHFTLLLLDFLPLRLYTCDMTRKIDWSKHNYHNNMYGVRREEYAEQAYQRDVERGKLKFGKHKGKTLQQVPMMYLRWIQNTWQSNSKFAKATIQNATHEIRRRQSIATPHKGTKVANPETSVPVANKH